MTEERKDSDIDKYKLDEELVKQVRLYDKFSEKLAFAKNDHSEAVDERELVEAELDSQIREDPGKFGLSKITEGAIEKATILHERYQSALFSERKCMKAMNILQAKVNTLDHRKKALEGLVQLLLSSYYSSDVRIPGATEEQKEEAKNMEKRAIRRRGRE